MLYQILAILFLAGTTATLTAQSSVSFEMFGDTYTTGGGSVVTGDFNNDGKPDIVECCGTNTLVFRAGNGDGTFQAPVNVATVSKGATSLVAADFNGDGNLDVAGLTGGIGATTLTVWYGNGNGTFQAGVNYTTTQTTDSLAVGNFFGDGHPDLAVGEGDGNIDLFRNEGSAFVFDKSINLGGGADAEVQLDAGDLNGTGVSDIVAAIMNIAPPTATYVLWNNGSGTFTQDELGTYTQPEVKMGYLNGDSMEDAIVAYTCNPTPNGSPAGKQPPYNPCAGFDVYYGQGGNSLYKATVIADSDAYAPSWNNGSTMSVADVNGDGYGDIVVATALSNYSDFGVLVWLGNANGSFQQTPEEFISNTDSDGPLAMADFNRDGMMDFVMDSGSDGNSEFFTNSTVRPACGTYTISPSVTVCQPVNYTYSPSPVKVEANSYDTTKVTAMQEYEDGSLVYSEPVTSFDTTFTASLGSHLFVTKGWDASGRDFVADRNITVYSGTPGPVCPATTDSANICLPSGASSSSPVEILANGNTGTVIPTAAQLYINGSLVANNEGYCYPNGDSCTGGTTYVQTTQTLASGTYSLVFKLWDANGDVYTATKTLTVD